MNFRARAVREANKGDVLNCYGKMPSLRKARLPGSCNLPEQLGMSPSRRLLGVLRPDQGFQQVVEIAFDPLAEHEPMITGEAAGVVARPEDQVVSLGDHDQFLVFFHLLMQMRGYNVMRISFSQQCVLGGPIHHARNPVSTSDSTHDRLPNWQ